MLKRILDNTIALFVVIVVMFLFIPLAPWLLDILLIVNLGLSVMILMITMNISEALDFSIFPSLLLITTLFRLGMNVSSTRMILTTGNPGVVIRNFGNLITGGNIVIGKQTFEDVEKRFKEMGFDRAFPPNTLPETTIEALRELLHMDGEEQ